MSAVDYILHEERLKEDSDVAIFNVTNYANFLKQTPNIGDFVPAKEVDGVWVILEEPDRNSLKYDFYISDVETDFNCQLYEQDLLEYKEAKKRVVFEWFEYENKEHLESFSILSNGEISLNYDDKYKTFELNRFYYEEIESLLEFNLTLTEQKAKELAL